MDSDHFKKIERLTVIMYDRTSHLSCVNEAREEIFCQKNHSIDRIPLTCDALLQHTRWALYQAGKIPSPKDIGWTMESGHWGLHFQRFQKHAVSSLNVPAKPYKI